MSSYYTYLLSSLPMLHFNGDVPFGYEQFLGLCEGKVPEADYALLRSLPEREGLWQVSGDAVLDSRAGFERDLRNELVHERARRRHVDAARYIRGDGFSSLAITHAAAHVFKIPAILDAERYLDQLRWEKLDELSAAHYFDRAALMYYAMKLLILLRWQRIRGRDAAGELERTLGEKGEASLFFRQQ